MSNRTCSVPDCGKAYRARGLCATHYNQQHQPNRHVKTEVACAHCGEPTLKFKTGQRYNAYCSWECQERGRWGEMWAAKKSLIVHPNPNRHTAKVARLVAAPVRKPRKFFAGFCEICSEPFVSVTTALTCSPACALMKLQSDRSEDKHKRRAREVAAFVAPVNRQRVFERDGWRCGICRKKVNRELKAPHPMSASLDHITPLSKGGTHEPVNVRLAHWLCNSMRSDTCQGEQLALIG